MKLIARLLSGRRIIGFADQILLSMVAFSQVVLYARTMPLKEYGAFAVFISVVVVAQGVHRAFVLLPLITTLNYQDNGLPKQWIRFNTRFAVVSSLVLAVASAMLLYCQLERESMVFLFAGLASFGSFIFEFNRKVLYVYRKNYDILKSSVAFTILQLLPTIIVFSVFGTAVAACAAYSVAVVLSAFGADLIRRGSVATTDGVSVTRVLVSRMFWNLGAFGGYAVFNSAMPAILGFAGGAQAVAWFSATRVFLTPVTLVITSVDNVDKPAASHALKTGGRPALRTQLISTSRTLLVLTVPYILLAATLSTWMGDLILGAKFAGSAPFIWAWLLAGMLMLLGQPLETGLAVLGKSNFYFWGRWSGAAVALAVLFLTPVGNLGLSAVLAVSAGWLCNAVISGSILRHELSDKGSLA